MHGCRHRRLLRGQGHPVDDRLLGLQALNALHCRVEGVHALNDGAAACGLLQCVYDLGTGGGFTLGCAGYGGLDHDAGHAHPTVSHGARRADFNCTAAAKRTEGCCGTADVAATAAAAAAYVRRAKRLHRTDAEVLILTGRGGGRLDWDGDNLLGAGLRIDLQRLDLDGLTLDILDAFELLQNLGGLGTREECGSRATYRLRAHF